MFPKPALLFLLFLSDLDSFMTVHNNCQTTGTGSEFPDVCR